MEITLYKYTGEFNRINKTLPTSDNLTMDIDFNLDYPILRPKIKIVTDTDLSDYNYCTFNGFNYFIESKDRQRTGIYYLQLLLDVIFQYKDVILKQHGTVIQSKTSLYLQGVNIPVDGRPQIKTYTFNDVFNHDGNYVLIANGYSGGD